MHKVGALKMKKKIYSVLLVLVLVLSLCRMPQLAFAAEDDESDAEIITGVSVRLTAPRGGDTTVDGRADDHVFVDPDENYFVEWASWATANDDGSLFVFADEGVGMTFIGGETYYLLITLKASDGCDFLETMEDSDAEVGGDGELVFIEDIYNSAKSGYSCVVLIASVEAEHSDDPGIAMSYIHVLSTEGGTAYFWCEEYRGDFDQPYGVPEGAEVELRASPQSGYEFVGWYKGDVNASSYDEMFTDELITTDNPYFFNATGYPYICAKFEYTGVERQGDQIEVWITDGGTASVTYDPTWTDSADIKAKDGTDYVSIGEIVAFWKGDEITVNAKPDDGFAFKGWYHVWIDWGPGAELPKYEGGVISTASSYTYKPGVTVVEGDSESLRYICAVFEEDATDPGTGTGVPGDADGDGLVTPADAALLARYLAGSIGEDALYPKEADMNGDGILTEYDASLLLRRLVGLY